MKVLKLTKPQATDIQANVSEANRLRGSHRNGEPFSPVQVIDWVSKYISGIPVTEIAVEYKVEPHRIRNGFHHSSYNVFFPQLHKFNRIKQLNAFSPLGLNAYINQL